MKNRTKIRIVIILCILLISIIFVERKLSEYLSDSNRKKKGQYEYVTPSQDRISYNTYNLLNYSLILDELNVGIDNENNKEDNKEDKNNFEIKGLILNYLKNNYNEKTWNVDNVDKNGNELIVSLTAVNTKNMIKISIANGEIKKK